MGKETEEIGLITVVKVDSSLDFSKKQGKLSPRKRKMFRWQLPLGKSWVST